MKVLVTVHAIESHIRAIQHVARTLLFMGHEVLVAAPVKAKALIEDAYRLPWVEARGDWTTTPGLGETLADALAQGNPKFVTTLIENYLTGPGSIAKARAVKEIIQEWPPDAVLADCTDIGSMIAASQLGIQCVSLDNGWYRQLADYRESVSIGLDRHWTGVIDADLPDTPVLTPCPRDLLYPDLDVIDYRVEHPHRFGETLPAWVARIPSRKPLIYASFGSILPGVDGFNEMILGLYRRIIEGLADIPCTAVLSVGRDNVSQLSRGKPDHVRLTGRIAQPLLLGTGVNVIITAGGLGTVKEILTTGIPPIVMPICSEHFHIARQVATLGLGRAVEPPGSADEIAAAASDLLSDPTYRYKGIEWIRYEMTLKPLESVLAKILS